MKSDHLLILRIVKKAFAILASLCICGGAWAQDSVPAYQNKFKITPAGRLLLDGALYFPDGDGFADGGAVPDIRLGVKASYGRWDARIIAGYGSNKLSMKDVVIRYNFNPGNYLQIGYFIHSFGLETATGFNMKSTMEQPVSDRFFAGLVNNLGVQYTYTDPKFFVGVSGIVAGNSMSKSTTELGKVSAGFLNRLVWRPRHASGLILQAGISTGWQTAYHTAKETGIGQTETSKGYFDFSSQFPTQVSKVDMLRAEISDARSMFKLSPEWIAAKGRLALEGQYYFMDVARRDRPSYQAHGVYANLRGILIGKDYGYNSATAALATPAPKSLELVGGFNYTDAHCRKADIFGGISSDYSLTLNYYFNKYVIARLHYAYAKVWGSDVQRARHVNILEARIQFSF